MSDLFLERQSRLLDKLDVGAVALVPGANMVYFTGAHFHLSERPTIALLTKSGCSFIVPKLELSVLESQLKFDYTSHVWTDEEGYEGAFQQAVEALGDASIGVDGLTMRVFEYLALQNAGASGLHDVAKDLLNIRAIKTQFEVDAMKKAIELSEKALGRLLEWVKPGMTEKAIVAQLTKLLEEEGSTGLAFGGLVQTGPNSALPHGAPGERVLEVDDFMLIDFGGMWDGYPADITRTFCLGTPTDEMQKIYDTVLVANRAAVAATKPGITCHEIDKAARDVIEAAGYGEYFIHRTGHGLGLEVHELPQIASGVDVQLEVGMVFTIEPGIYVPGIGGVRIEDNIHVTEDSAEVLTQFRRELSVK